MKITIKDVAKYANVSPTTVSLVLNNRNGVKDSTKQRVLEAIKRLNFTPNHVARSLVNKKNYVIGIVLTNIENPFFGDLAMKLQNALKRTEYNMILACSEDSVEQEKIVVRHLMQRGVDGLLLVPARDGENDLEHLYQLRALKVPFVFMVNQYRGIKADSVMADYETSMCEATKLLLEKGERKIYFITDYKQVVYSKERIKGYKKAFRDMGASYKEEWIVEIKPDVEGGIRAMEKILEKDMPDAIISLNSMVGMGVMKVLRDYGIKVPEDVSLICYDDLTYLSLLYTAMTSLQQPVNDLAYKAIDLLLERIEGKENKVFEQILLPVKMLIRDSTK